VLHGRARGRGAELAGDVEDVGDPDAVLPPRRTGRDVQRLGEAGHRQARSAERVRGDGQLRVPDVLPGQVARRAEHQVGDVGRLADQAADRAVDVREVREVPELVEGGQLRLSQRDPRTPRKPSTVPMPARQREHGRHRRRTDQVKVKFYLRQPVDKKASTDSVADTLATLSAPTACI
jgi:hypothetical protein